MVNPQDPTGEWRPRSYRSQVTPVGAVVGPEGEFAIGAGGAGQVTQKMRDMLTGIQTGRRPDPHGWVVKL